jgi:hypothetical protein
LNVFDLQRNSKGLDTIKKKLFKKNCFFFIQREGDMRTLIIVLGLILNLCLRLDKLDTNRID